MVSTYRQWTEAGEVASDFLAAYGQTLREVAATVEDREAREALLQALERLGLPENRQAR